MKSAYSIPAEAVLIYNNALNLTDKGDFIPALDEYKKAISMYPEFLEAYNNIGELYSKMGDSTQAKSTYIEALTIDRNYKVLLNLGVEFYNEGSYDQALKHFNESVDRKADFIEGQFYAGMANFNLKNFKRAEVHFNNVIAMDFKHLKTNYLLSTIYYEWKNYKKSMECLDRIKDIADDPVLVNKFYGFCCYHLGRFPEAIDYLQTAMESCPAYDKFKSYIKSLSYENKLSEIGNLKEKISEMETRINKKNSVISLGDYTHLSMLYIFDGEYAKAQKLLKSAKI
jgi:tetratricopeptide (TPR) repeat protein